MKKLITVLTLSVITMSSYAQLTIQEIKDDMTDKVTYLTSESLMCATPDLSLGFRIDPNITVVNDKKVVNNIIVLMVGLGSCNEKNQMIILFENGDKITLVSWNDFNCKGTSYFSLNKATTDKLKEHKIAKIRLTNGNTYKNYTSELEYTNYFIELYSVLN